MLKHRTLRINPVFIPRTSQSVLMRETMSSVIPLDTINLRCYLHASVVFLVKGDMTSSKKKFEIHPCGMYVLQ